MATTSSIPAKYLYALVYFAAARAAEYEERIDAKNYFESEGYKRLALASASDDYYPNDLKSSKVGFLG